MDTFTLHNHLFKVTKATNVFKDEKALEDYIHEVAKLIKKLKRISDYLAFIQDQEKNC